MLLIIFVDPLPPQGTCIFVDIGISNFSYMLLYMQAPTDAPVLEEHQTGDPPFTHRQVCLCRSLSLYVCVHISRSSNIQYVSLIWTCNMFYMHRSCFLCTFYVLTCLIWNWHIYICYFICRPLLMHRCLKSTKPVAHWSLTSRYVYVDHFLCTFLYTSQGQVTFNMYPNLEM